MRLPLRPFGVCWSDGGRGEHHAGVNLVSLLDDLVGRVSVVEGVLNGWLGDDHLLEGNGLDRHSLHWLLHLLLNGVLLLVASVSPAAAPALRLLSGHLPH